MFKSHINSLLQGKRPFQGDKYYFYVFKMCSVCSSLCLLFFSVLVVALTLLALRILTCETFFTFLSENVKSRPAQGNLEQQPISEKRPFNCVQMFVISIGVLSSVYFN